MINGKNRDFCPLAHQNILIMSAIISVACAIIYHNRHILCTQRSEKMAHPNQWEFPGGKIELGETAADCLLREIKEELDIHVKIAKPLPVFQYSYSTKQIELIPFICLLDNGEVSLKEHQQYKWLPISELEELNWVEADIAIVRYLIKNSEVINFLNH